MQPTIRILIFGPIFSIFENIFEKFVMTVALTNMLFSTGLSLEQNIKLNYLMTNNEKNKLNLSSQLTKYSYIKPYNFIYSVLNKLHILY